MLQSYILPVLLVIGNVLGVVMILPQVLRLRRTRKIEGVSAIWIGVGLAMNVWWIVYGVQASLWGLIPVSSGALVLYGLLAVYYVELRGCLALRRLATGIGAVGLVPLVALAVRGWEAAGLAVGLLYAVQFAPAVVEAVRSTDVAGISAATWYMALGEAAIWFVYGMANSDLALLVGGGGGAVMATAILYQLRRVFRNAVPAEVSLFT